MKGFAYLKGIMNKHQFFSVFLSHKSSILDLFSSRSNDASN